MKFMHKGWNLAACAFSGMCIFNLSNAHNAFAHFDLIECKSIPNEKKAVAEVILTGLRDDLLTPMKYEVSYSYDGPNSMGNRNEFGSHVKGKLQFTPEEVKKMWVMGPDGEYLIVFSRKEGAFSFQFTAKPEGDGYVSHSEGKPISYGVALKCTRERSPWWP